MCFKYKGCLFVKYQLKVIFKKILNNIDLIKKFINLKPEKIYEFSKEIYLSEDISKHLEFINEEEFWQEIFSMITGKEIHELEDLEKIAGGRISLKKSFVPSLLSFLTVGGHLLPGSDYILSPVVNAGKFEVTAGEVQIDEPKTSLAVINTINRNPTLKKMFGFAENANVTELTDNNIKTYGEKTKNSAGTDDAASYFLVLVHALPLIAHKFSNGTDLNMDGLLKIFTDDEEKYSLVNFIGKLKSDATNSSTKNFVGVAVNTLKAVALSVLPGTNWGKYTESNEEDLARVQLLIAYYEDYVFKTNATTFKLNDSLRQSVDDFFGKFYANPQRQKPEMTASGYADTVLSKYIKPLKTLNQDAATDLLNAFKQKFPILNTVSDTFDKVKGIASDIKVLTDEKNPEGVQVLVGKVKQLVSKLTDWHYPHETLEAIKIQLCQIVKANGLDEVNAPITEIKKILAKRQEFPDGTPIQKKLDEYLEGLCADPSANNNEEKRPRTLEETKQSAEEILRFIEDAEAAKSDLDMLVQGGQRLIDDVREKLQSEEGLLGKGNRIADDVKKVTGFLSNPWLAAGVLGAGGAALLEGTTGIFSKVFKGIFHEATSVFGGVRKFYNEKIYNNLFLEKDPMKLKKLVSEYLKSTLMFPGQASDKVAEVLSANKLSGQVPAMLELSGNVCSEVFSEIHRSMFERNFETWQKIDVAQQKPQVISRTISDDSKEKITLSLADTIFNTTNSSMRKLKNNTGTTLVFENLADQSVIDRLEEARKTGVLSLYNNTTGEHEELDVSKTVILISNKRKDNKVILENSEHIKFEDFTEEEYAYILADKLSEKREKYYKQYKNTVEFSDDFIENISKKAVKDHAGYNDAEKYIKNIDSALLSFLSQNIETNNLQLECYIDENDQFMFKEQEIIIENQEEPEQEIETENEQNLEEIEIT